MDWPVLDECFASGAEFFRETKARKTAAELAGQASAHVPAGVRKRARTLRDGDPW
jgi:hypothetical protein